MIPDPAFVRYHNAEWKACGIVMRLQPEDKHRAKGQHEGLQKCLKNLPVCACGTMSFLKYAGTKAREKIAQNVIIKLNYYLEKFG